MSSNLKFLVYGNTLAALVVPLVILAATDGYQINTLGVVGAGISFALHLLAAAVAQGLGELAIARRGTAEGEPRPPISS